MKHFLTDKERKKVQEYEITILEQFDKICKQYNLNYTVAAGTMIGAVRHKGFIPWDDDIDVYMLRKDFNKLREIAPKELPKNMFYQSHHTDSEYYYLFDKIRLNGTIFKETFLSNHNINHGVFIDVFPIDAISDNAFKSNWQYFRYRFYRLGLMAKYVNLDARKGKKKKVVQILQKLYAFADINNLYDKCERIANESLKLEGSTKFVRNLNSLGSDGKKETYSTNSFKNFHPTQFENSNFAISDNFDEMLTKLYGDYMQLPPAEDRKTRHDLKELKL
ncbi:LicD family protein [Lactobacillus isalae]|uniref:LicD family protein n=1 Tax=Lactobacillus isalae TaxID=2993455 RepID=UPI0024A85DD1|nr:LicD family protein [Lactobacillus isalae]